MSRMDVVASKYSSESVEHFGPGRTMNPTDGPLVQAILLSSWSSVGNTNIASFFFIENMSQFLRGRGALDCHQICLAVKKNGVFQFTVITLLAGVTNGYVATFFKFRIDKADMGFKALQLKTLLMNKYLI